MPNIVLSRENPLSSVNRWGIADGTRLLHDENGCAAVFMDRGAAERHVELFTLYNGRHDEFRAVPVPYTPIGKAGHHMRALMNMVLVGARVRDMTDEQSEAYYWASMVTHWHMPGDTELYDDAANYVARLAVMGFTP